MKCSVCDTIHLSEIPCPKCFPAPLADEYTNADKSTYDQAMAILDDDHLSCKALARAAEARRVSLFNAAETEIERLKKELKTQTDRADTLDTAAEDYIRTIRSLRKRG